MHVLSEEFLGAQPDLAAALKAHSPFQSFRPGQAEVVAATLAGRDVLAVLPTGAGKSLCYQFASRFLPGITVVVSPLIALMKDQVDKMWGSGDRGGIYLNSSLPPGDQASRLRAIRAGLYRLVYVSPEALRNGAVLGALSLRGVSLLVVDEAHCISHWGHDFRPDYLALRDARTRMGSPKVLAMTATATVQVQHDIVECLGLVNECRIVLPFDRPNLRIDVERCHGLREKTAAVQRLLGEVPGPAIVYVGQRQSAESLAEQACRWGRRAAAYHAGLPNEQRSRVQEAFMRDELDLVVATNAFGMGVDKPDIRVIVEFTLPGTLEELYQQAGRAGRDGQPARSVLLFDESDRAFHEALHERESLDPAILGKVRDVLLENRHGQHLFVPRDAIEGATGASETQVRVALSLLERIGFVKRLPDCPSKVFVRSHRHDAGEALSSEEERLLGVLVEACGPDFDRGMVLDCTDLGDAAALGPDTLDDVLLSLGFRGQIEYRRLERRRTFLLQGDAEVDFDAAMNWIDELRREQRLKLDALVGLARSGACRRRTIRMYFGERDVPERCGACDSCCEERRPRFSTEPERTRGWLEVTATLDFIESRGAGLGRTGLVRALRAEEAPLVGHSADRARELINQLIEADLLQVYYRPEDRLCSYPLVSLSTVGRELWEARSPVYIEVRPTRPAARKRAVEKPPTHELPAGAHAGARERPRFAPALEPAVSGEKPTEIESVQLDAGPRHAPALEPPVSQEKAIDVESVPLDADPRHEPQPSTAASETSVAEFIEDVVAGEEHLEASVLGQTSETSGPLSLDETKTSGDHLEPLMAGPDRSMKLGRSRRSAPDPQLGDLERSSKRRRRTQSAPALHPAFELVPRPRPRKPSRAQTEFRRLKETFSGKILMLRCGAFYEFREDDAEKAAALLGLRVGRRGLGEAGSLVTGVPIGSAMGAAERLQAQGHAVVLLRKGSEQGEAPGWAHPEVERALP